MPKDKVLIGTNNKGKLTEFLFYLNYFKILKKNSLLTLDRFTDIDEPNENGNTFSDNASIKANYFYKKTGISTLSDDSGFILNSTKDFPGIQTARFAKKKGGIDLAVKSIFLDSKELNFIPVTFYCSLAFKTEDRVTISEGKIQGNMIKNSLGKNGFGFDPYFIPEGSQKTYAEMDKKEKLLRSHRFRAFRSLEKLLK